MVTAPVWILNAAAQHVCDAQGVLLIVDDGRFGRETLPAAQLAASAPDLVAALVLARKEIAAALYGLEPEKQGKTLVAEAVDEIVEVLQRALSETAPALARALGHVPQASPNGSAEAWPWA